MQEKRRQAAAPHETHSYLVSTVAYAIEEVKGQRGQFGKSGYNTGMVIHTFAFRWKAGVREEQKLRAITAIRGLQGKIPGLLETWVGVNFSPRSQGYELGGTMKFAGRAELEAYGVHPVHQELLQWLMPLIDPVEVDFEA